MNIFRGITLLRLVVCNVVFTSRHRPMKTTISIDRMNGLYLAAAFIIFASPLARAVTPETGIYYNSLRQGLGYYVEVQGTKLVMIAFAFDRSTGNPLFYYASGAITKAEPGYSPIFDPPTQHMLENAYQFTGNLYLFGTGPCITCHISDWDTSSHAQVVGKIFLRFSDIDKMYVSISMDNGKSIGSVARRQAFGKKGFNLRWDSIAFTKYDNSLKYIQPIFGFTGTWIFSDLEDLSAPPIRFDFDKEVGPLPTTDSTPSFGAALGGNFAQFTDTNKNAVITCSDYGCGLQIGDEVPFVIKYWDIGSDLVLAYSGDQLFEDGNFILYRGEHLISGIRITDPIPDAPPPPTDTEGQP